MTKILGVNISHHTSFALIENNKLKEYYEEDRFNKLKGFINEDVHYKYKALEKFKNISFDCVAISSFGRYGSISDFEIYENITNPYLTANVVFVDQENIVQDMDIQGGEKLSLSFYHVEEMTKGTEKR